MRTRTEGSMSNAQTSVYLRKCNGSEQTWTYNLPLFANGKTKLFQDVTVPGFKKASAQGFTYCNPCVSITDQFSAAPGSQKADFLGFCSGTATKANHWTGYITRLSGLENLEPGWCPIPGEDLLEVMVEAYVRACAAPGQPDVSALTNIAEVPKLLATLAGNAQQFYIQYMKAVRAYIKYNKRRENPRYEGREEWTYDDVVGWITSNWLQYRYVFTPIYLDAVAAFDAFMKVKGPDRETHRAFGGVNFSNITTDTFSGSHFSVDFGQTQLVNVKVRAGCLVQTAPANVAEVFGFHYKEFNNAVWELIPFSFMVDWFANVNEFIAFHNPVVGYKGLQSWTTLTYEYSTMWSASYTPKNVAGFTYSSYSDDVGVRNRTMYVRAPKGPVSLTMRPLNFAQRKWRNRFLDVAAIVGSGILGMPRPDLTD